MLGSAIEEITSRGGIWNNPRPRRRRASRWTCVLERTISSPFNWANKACSDKRNEVDQMLVERLFLGERFGLPDGLFGELTVAAAFGNHASEAGGSIVFHFAAHHWVHLLAHEHRGCGAGICAGRHGGDVACFEDHEPGGGRTGAAWPDIGDHGDGRGKNLLIDVPGGVQQSARSV